MASESLKFLGRLKRLEGQLSRLASEMSVNFPFGNSCAALWRPPTDVYETESELVVCIEAPGLQADDISIELHPDTLVIRGVRREPRHDEKCVYHQLEIRYGLFECVLHVPRCIASEGGVATYRDGFLVIHLPKRDGRIEHTEVIRLRI